jgi:hypothetical protein
MSRQLLCSNYAVIMLPANYWLPLTVGSFIAITYTHSDDDTDTYAGIEVGADNTTVVN